MATGVGLACGLVSVVALGGRAVSLRGQRALRIRNALELALGAWRIAVLALTTAILSALTPNARVCTRDTFKLTCHILAILLTTRGTNNRALSVVRAALRRGQQVALFAAVGPGRVPLTHGGGVTNALDSTRLAIVLTNVVDAVPLATVG